MGNLQAPKGTYDVIGQTAAMWRYVEDAAHSVARDFGFAEIRTPMFEFTEVFVRGIGETTDVVQKEMYTFIDAGGRSLTLRPEGTAGVCRSIIENGLLGGTLPLKLYYMGPNFRAEKPEKGRTRQFTQFGTEIFGSSEPFADAEIMAVAHELFRRLGLHNIELRINSIGNPECRQRYNGILKEYIKAHNDELCPLCRERGEKNPLRVLDCKNDRCKRVLADAPTVLDTLGDECKAHFAGVCAALDAMGIPYAVDKKIVRGLDYYTRTVFEFVTTDLGSQSTICGGGRYDNLVDSFGGGNVPAVGFGMGIDRLLLVMQAQGKAQNYVDRPHVFIAGVDGAGTLKALAIVQQLRRHGFLALTDISARKPKANMKYADKIGARYTVFIGASELETGTVNIRSMADGTIATVNIEKIPQWFEDNTIYHI